MSAAKKRWTVAAVQMTSTENRKKNLAAVERLAKQAKDRGADLIAFPENFTYLRSEGSKIRFSESLDGDLVEWLGQLSRQLGVFLLAGSIPEKIRRSSRIHNTSLLFGPRGDLLARYRKIHLFDINIRGGAVFMESKTVAPGDTPVVVDTPLGRLGLSDSYHLGSTMLRKKGGSHYRSIEKWPEGCRRSTAFTLRPRRVPFRQATEQESSLCGPARLSYR